MTHHESDPPDVRDRGLNGRQSRCKRPARHAQRRDGEAAVCPAESDEGIHDGGQTEDDPDWASERAEEFELMRLCFPPLIDAIDAVPIGSAAIAVRPRP